MAKKFYNQIDPNTILAIGGQVAPKQKGRNQDNTPAPASESIQEPQEDENIVPDTSSTKKYMRLDITAYQDYIRLMSEHQSMIEHKYVSMTQFILQLVEQHKKNNLDLYKKLQKIEQMKKELI